jgi:hypothetical protein
VLYEAATPSLGLFGLHIESAAHADHFGHHEIRTNIASLLGVWDFDPPVLPKVLVSLAFQE